MSNEKPVELTVAEKVPLLQAYTEGPIAMLYAVQDIVSAREAAAREEGANETFQGLKHRAEKVEAKVARVEALAEELEADAERHRNAETLTAEDGARAYRAAVESAASAAAIRAALAEPERDEESGR